MAEEKMHNQSPATGRNIPTNIRSRVRVVGPKKPLKNDAAKSAASLTASLKTQREALK